MDGLSRRWAERVLLGYLCAALVPTSALAGDAPAWLRAQLTAPIPAHDDKTVAVEMYSETVLTVTPKGQLHRLERKAFRILRSGGESWGVVRPVFDAQSRTADLRGWSIPAAGKEYEVKDRDTIESAITDVDGAELVSDLRTKVLRLPAATPGSLVGYEFETDQRPYEIADEWYFQDVIPVREARYTLQLPKGWSYRATWLNHESVDPIAIAPGQWQWVVNDVAAIPIEAHMPPWRGIAGSVFLSPVPPDQASAPLPSWCDIGIWYLGLTRGRQDATPAIRQKVADLTAGAATPLAKMQALAGFVQNDIRYVAIELGLGGHQPHPAAETLLHRYGDCKDKATLLGAMLREIGIESYYVIINTERGSVTPTTPANLGFNHAVLAIAVPPGMDDPMLASTATHTKLGRLLYFDPTDSLTPLGRLSGPLQANYGMLVTPDGGELVKLPQLDPAASGIRRTAKLTLDADGTLHGDVTEVSLGDAAGRSRAELRSVSLDTERIKTVENLLSKSLSSYSIESAAVGNLRTPELPFEWHYTFRAPNYGRATGSLVLVRPRVIGRLTSSLLDAKEPRRAPVEFTGPERDTDVFEVAVPAGYALDELPAPVDVDLGFARYVSHCEFTGGVLRYTRTFEVRELSVPINRVGELRQLYHTIDTDERNTAVFRRPGG